MEGDFEAAARSFQKAVDLEPTNLEQRLAQGAFLRAWGEQQPSRARLRQGLSLTEALLTARPTWRDASGLREELRRALARLPAE
jgi:eukaryotic-like serine/threonine-protein kinase